MASKINREESIRIAAEKMRRKKEREKQKDKEYFERITSGKPWLLFKLLVVACTLLAILTTIDVFVDGETRKLKDSEWRIDRELYLQWHQSVKVGDYLFTPRLDYWLEHVEGTFEITYSPIFQTAKKLSYDLQVEENTVKRHEVIRRRSIFSWFPYFQIMLLIPLLTFLFKTQNPWFYFARFVSIFAIIPATLVICYFSFR